MKTHWLLGGLLVVGAVVPGRLETCGTSGPARRGPVVRPGIEVLLSDSLHLVRGRRVGLVTNQAGVDHRGVSDVDLLRHADLRLVALFSPEHGFRGTAAPGEAIGSSVDSATGLPIYSLYGSTSAPTDAMLAGLDVVLVDLQDAGARYYTYLWTTVGVMRSAARKGIPVVVLDRPDPIAGPVQGNVLDTAFRSPVGLLAVPMRHGMTLGELALLARHDLGLTTDLTVVPAAGWHRSMYLDQTGLPFVPPSPNLRSLQALIHYPGTCLFEGTDLSVGRGTDHAFEQIGAPGLDTAAVLALVHRAAPPGVAFASVSFTPRRPGDGKYADTLVLGIRLRVTNRRTYDPARTAVALLEAVIASAGCDGCGPGAGSSSFRFRWLAPQFDRLAGGAALRELLAAGRAADPGWAEALRRFEVRRRPYLLYPD
jgi:uncharacterized protein YbbC (DUF1343 family)